MDLNRDNFLRWTGAFNNAVIVNSAVNDVAVAAYNVDNIEIDILNNDISTYGIDFSSIIITVQDNMSRPATWNASTRRLRYYLRAGESDGAVRTLKYTWSDVNGNASNEATVNITITPRATAWQVDTSTGACELVGGVKTGYIFYSMLQKYYPDNGAPVFPAVSKPNVNTDPDYVPKSINSACAPIDYANVILKTGTSSTVCGSVTTVSSYVPRTQTRYVIGTEIFSNSAMTIPIADGFYVDSDYKLTVSHGVVTNIQFCSETGGH